MDNIDNSVLDMVNILYMDGKYDEALEGLKLLKSTIGNRQRYKNNSKGLKIINDLIRICEAKRDESPF